MLKVVVRGRKDAGAVKAMIKRFYPDWGMEVLTLQGVRGDEAIVSELASLVNPRYFYVVLLGSSEVRDVDAVEGALPPNVIVHVVSKAKVRNARIDELAREFDVARTAIRLRTRWCREYEAYAFSSKGEELRSFRYDPVYDAFLGLGLWGKLVGEVIGLGELENPLIVRGAGGEHVVYCGPEPCGVFKVFNDRLEVKGRKLTEPLHREVHLENLLKANEEVLRLYEGISAEVLRSFRGWADYVVVPWSGGKDSTAALVLALKVFPRKKVTAVYSDTGIEFPQTQDYIEEVSRRLSVEVVRVRAGVDRGILEEGLPLPTHDNRWCTLRKISSVDNFVRGLRGNVLVVVGDRDAESESRFRRPAVRRLGSSRIEVAPLKFWGTALTQLYIYWNNLKPNPLYLLGFYRIGCYICPALRSWELRVLLSIPEVNSVLKDRELFKRFISSRLK